MIRTLRLAPTTQSSSPLGYGEVVSTSDTEPLPQVSASRSLLLVALGETFRRWGARIGLVWVVFLLLLAVFAPLIANSRPIVVKYADGSLGSPFWNGLTLIDMALPVIFLVALALIVALKLTRLEGAVALLILLGVSVAAVGTGWLLADPPLLERYSVYRSSAENGQYQWAVHAPIRFSPNDRISDLGNARTIPPWWSAPMKRGLHSLAPSIFEEVADETKDALARVPTDHWLGTTVNGEDMASRMIHAARVALAIGIVATGISTLIGVFVGAGMGYFGGVTDLLLMRLIEIVQALPALVVLLIVTSFFGKDIWLMMVAIGLMSWTGDARFVRAEFLRLRTQDFVQAARAVGLPLHRILFRHMLPNGISPVLVNASFGIAGAILLESFLSFLGLGLEAKDPSWGQLLNQARSAGTGFNWWIAIFPGLAIFLTVFAYILIGESMRDAIDPKLRKD